MPNPAPDNDPVRDMRGRCRAVMDRRVRALASTMRPYLSDMVQGMLMEQWEAICRSMPFPGDEDHDWSEEE